MKKCKFSSLLPCKLKHLICIWFYIKMTRSQFYGKNPNNVITCVPQFNDACIIYCLYLLFLPGCKSNPSPQERDNMFLGHMSTVMEGTSKKWQCSFCGKTAKLKGDILDHVECMHMNTAFTYACRYCSTELNTNRKLRLHEVSNCSFLTGNVIILCFRI